ncbi:hypothetical protein [Nonomuraea fuscirosea]|uniref:hypothetical protein n=1 Tax=Nonomuraea fuscirosea TaxID=1291556 RepID=UPI00340AB9C0
MDDVRDLRPLMRGFVESLRQHKVMSGSNQGKQLSANGLRQPLVTVETFYRWMFDNSRQAATLLDEPRWLRLTPQHMVLFRPEDKPRLVNKLSDDLALEDQVVNQIAAGSELLALPKDQGGIGDVQAFHALMLQIRTGRRMSEILLMDFEPLSPLLHASQEAKEAAKRRATASSRGWPTSRPKSSQLSPRRSRSTPRSWRSFTRSRRPHASTCVRGKLQREACPVICSCAPGATGSAATPTLQRLTTAGCENSPSV